MSESIFTSIMEEYAERDWEKYSNAPEHKFSLKHRLAMKMVFRRYERNTKHLRSNSAQSISSQKYRPTPKRLLMLLVIILLAMIAGCSIAYVARSFNVEVYSNHTVLSVINMENSPAFIEDQYYLSELPEEFELLETQLSPEWYRPFIIKYYENKQTGQIIRLCQNIKSGFGPIDYRIEENKFFKTEINGHSAVLIDISSVDGFSTYIIWDNGDYILSVAGNISKKELLKLAKSAKPLENPDSYTLKL